MTPAEIRRTFVIAFGEIRNEGTWEGEPEFAPFYYFAWRRGRPANSVTPRNENVLALYFIVSDEDRKAFPEALHNVNGVQVFVENTPHRAFIHCDPDRKRRGRPAAEDDDDEDEDDA